MTLIITELTPFGIAMAADSAFTEEEVGPWGLKVKRTLHGARKLQVIPHFPAGFTLVAAMSVPR